MYERLCKLTDQRGANGKLHRLETVLMIVVMAKWCGEDPPFGMAESAQYRQAEFVKYLRLSRGSMPSHHIIRRILAYKVYAEEVERLVGKYNRLGERGQVYALDGNAVRGMRKKTRRSTSIC